LSPLSYAEHWFKASFDEGQRAVLSFTAFNGAILLLWKVPRLQAFMRRNFLHSPLSGADVVDGMG
jgi:hypothetical protein